MRQYPHCNNSNNKRLSDNGNCFRNYLTQTKGNIIKNICIEKLNQSFPVVYCNSIDCKLTLRKKANFTHYIKQITNKNLLYSTGNSIQQSVITYMGLESKKSGYMCMYNQLTLLYSRNITLQINYIPIEINLKNHFGSGMLKPAYKLIRANC